MNSVKQASNKVAIAAIICICLMELNAMWHGVNGLFLNISMCLIAGIAGYKVKPELVHGTKDKMVSGAIKIFKLFRRKHE